MVWGSSICSNRSRDLFNLSQSPVSLPLSDPDLGVLILITHNDVTNISAFNQQEMQRLSREETHATNNKMFSPDFLKSCVLQVSRCMFELELALAHVCSSWTDGFGKEVENVVRIQLSDRFTRTNHGHCRAKDFNWIQFSVRVTHDHLRGIILV